MNGWLWALTAVVVAVLSVRWLLRRRNAAGITTGMGARGAQVGGLMARSVWRRGYLRVRKLLASRERKRELEEAYHVQTAAEAAEMMGNMKGVFMKLGQIVSFANDALPEAAAERMRTLQSEAPPMDFRLARGVIESELGGDLGRYFADIDEEPLASASIGQVHKARTLDGRQVVLKVQYPGVDAAIENDLKMSAGIAAMVQAVHKNADAKAIVSELKERLLDELDYRQEAANQELFGRLWRGHPLIRIPDVHRDLTTKRVLCQSLSRGMSFYDFVDAANEREKRTTVFVINDFVFDSMHRFHVFNGDPHPGNYLFHEDGGVTFLDFGCVKYFPARFITMIQAMNRTLIDGDREGFDKLIADIGIVLPGRPYDHERTWAFFQYHGAPSYRTASSRSPRSTSRRPGRSWRRWSCGTSTSRRTWCSSTASRSASTRSSRAGGPRQLPSAVPALHVPDEQVPPAAAQFGATLAPRFLDATPSPVEPPEPIPERRAASDGGAERSSG